MCENLYVGLDFFPQLVDTPAPILQSTPKLSSQSMPDRLHTHSRKLFQHTWQIGEDWAQSSVTSRPPWRAAHQLVTLVRLWIYWLLWMHQWLGKNYTPTTHDHQQYLTSHSSCLYNRRWFVNSSPILFKHNQLRPPSDCRRWKTDIHPVLVCR